MDVILEVFDTLLFDRLYAAALPISSTAAPFDPISTISASLKGYAGNATSSLADGGSFARSAWQYQPASQSFGLQPSEYAYMSQWDRDNIYRQSLSLYLVTW